MRVFNNTDLNTKLVLFIYSGLIKNVVGGLNAVESIAIEKDKIVVFGIECVLGEFSLNSRELKSLGA